MGEAALTAVSCVNPTAVMDGRRDTSGTNDISRGPAPNRLAAAPAARGASLSLSANPVGSDAELCGGKSSSVPIPAAAGRRHGWGGEDDAASASCSSSLS